MAPTPSIDGARAAHRRLFATLDALTDADVGRPSRLPGWTVGHVLTHLARNADSHVRMLEAAWAGAVVDQYVDGREGRARDIEAGAARPARELADDAARAARRLEDVWAATPEPVWAEGRGRVTDGEWPVRQLPFRRWREVEIHHADLGLGYGWDDWPDAYVTWS